jgi:hypothetical protein
MSHVGWSPVVIFVKFLFDIKRLTILQTLQPIVNKSGINYALFHSVANRATFILQLMLWFGKRPVIESSTYISMVSSGTSGNIS